MSTTDSSFLAIAHAHGAFSLLPARGRVYRLDYKGKEAIWRPDVVEGWNIGGDRLWIAPERDWHWTDVSTFDLDNYLVAEAIDPGSWRIARQSAHTLAVTQSFTVQHRRRPAFVHGTVERRFVFNTEPRPALPGLEDRVNWSTTDTLELAGGTPHQGMNLWRILQVPVGGEMFVPTAGAAHRLHFGDDTRLVTVSPTGITAMITGDQMYKIGLGQQSVADCIAYARPITPNSLLVIVRWFQISPGATYLDTPMDQPGTPGDVIQIYNDNGVFGGFGELEVHGPGLRVPARAEAVPGTRISDTLLTAVGTMSRDAWEMWKQGRHG